MRRQNRTSGPALPQLSAGLVTAALAGLSLAVALAVVAPRGAYLWLAVTAISLWAVHAAAGLPALRTASAPTAWLAFTAWAAASALWSADPGESALRAALAALLILIVIAGAHWTAAAPPERLHPVVKGALVGLGIGLAFILVESLTDQWLTTVAMRKLELLRPGGNKHLSIEDGAIRGVGEYVLNRPLTAMSIFLWPGLLLLASRTPPLNTRWLRLVLVLAAGAAVIFSVHESSKLAFLAGLAIYALASFRLGIGRRAVIAGWTAMALLVIPLAQGLYAADLHKAEWLPLSARARVVLWHYTAEQYLEAPLIGIGARSTKIEFQQRDTQAEWPQGYPYPLQTGRHSHNVFLQTWYELGVVGAVFMFIAGLATIRAISRLVLSAQPYALAAFASVTAMASSSYGLWQSWFLALLAFAAIFTFLGSKASGPHKPAR